MSGKTGQVLQLKRASRKPGGGSDRKSAEQKARQVAKKLESMKLKAAAGKVREGIGDTFSYYDFPDSHWVRIRTNNPLERIMREIRRRTRVVGAFPDGNSAVMLCAARLRHIAGTKWGTKRYLSMEPLYQNSEIKEAVA